MAIPSFEHYSRKVLQQPNVLLKLGIGVLLTFFIIPIPVVIGFVFNYCRNIRDTGRTELPSWLDWRKLLGDGIVASLLVLLYFGAPWLAVKLVADFFNSMDSAFMMPVGVLAQLPLLFVYVFCPVLTAAAFYRLPSTLVLNDLLRADLLIEMTLASWRHWVFPIMAFYGLCYLTMFFYGLPLFLGFFFLAGYLSVVFVHLESSGTIRQRFAA